MTIERTSYVVKVDEGRVVFDYLASVYRAPPDLEPIFRAALAKGREVKFTHTADRSLVTAELMPAAPLWTRLGRMVDRLHLVWIRRRHRASQSR